nr:MAG TPA: hypothetical protein [Caudoviricetes sp.]
MLNDFFNLVIKFNNQNIKFWYGARYLTRLNTHHR